jgi:hypothetical protein
MPRKPNYRFERFERERQKAEKKAERLAAKKERAGPPKADQDGDEVQAQDETDTISG